MKLCLVVAALAFAQPHSPWGVSASASSFRDHAEWFPKVAEAGVTSVRLFPEWRGVEPKKGTWRWDDSDALVKNAAENKLEITAVLMGSPPGTKMVHAFPMDDLDGWSAFVTACVERYKKQIRHWEVWNEGNGGFNDGKHTTADYAKLAAVTYAAIKKADPTAKVGLSVASFDAPYLNETILAMKKQGTPNRFDYLCIHPYEIADHVNGPNGEASFLWMTRLLRDALKKSAPEKADCEIWITEVGARIEKKKDGAVTEADAAKALAKIYTMALAQGISRIQWFEARDPVGEDAGFGLIDRAGKPRASYRTLKTMTELLGPLPKYRGWVTVGDHGYGFVFDAKAPGATVLVAWTPAGTKEQCGAFPNDLEMIDSATGGRTFLNKGEKLSLTETPVFIVGDDAIKMIKWAEGNAGRMFPWGGDFSAEKTVRCLPGAAKDADANQGVVALGRDRPKVTFADGSTGLVVPGDIGNAVNFVIHPSFANINQREYYIRATVRRMGGGNVGMNCIYEVADSQGKAPYANVGKWFGANKDTGWQTYTWEVKDACFSKMWGFDFALRPEQSIPFAIGKVEVSTEPFR